VGGPWLESAVELLEREVRPSQDRAATDPAAVAEALDLDAGTVGRPVQELHHEERGRYGAVGAVAGAGSDVDVSEQVVERATLLDFDGVADLGGRDGLGAADRCEVIRPGAVEDVGDATAHTSPDALE